MVSGSDRSNVKYHRYAVYGLLIAVAAVAAFAWSTGTAPEARAISSSGGVPLTATNTPALPYQLQTDPAWAGETVGGSGEPLSSVGCTVCCVSMAFCQLGLETTPKELNSKLKQLDGYTGSGLLNWKAAEKASCNTIAIEIPSTPTHEAIDSAVQKGNPVLTKVLLWESVPHWVLIVGKDGTEYLVKNPLSQDKAIHRLSEFSKKIQSIRIARKR